MHSELRSVFAVVLALSLLGTTAAAVDGSLEQSPASVQTVNASGVGTISVSASGDASGEPDLAVVHLESVATATDPGNASARLAANVSQLRSALLDANLPEDAIRTTDYNLFEASDRGTPGPASERNATLYRAQQGVAVEVRNTSRVGELVDVAVANGATGVRGVEFTLSEDARAALRDRALEEAMTTARSEATTIAAAEGLRISGVRSVSTGDGDVQPLVARETVAAADADTRIDGGPVTVRATVQVTYVATG